jgi:hypothetical protein
MSCHIHIISNGSYTPLELGMGGMRLEINALKATVLSNFSRSLIKADSSVELRKATSTQPVEFIQICF